LRLLPRIQHALGSDYEVTVAAMHSQIGSGALPVDQIPSHGLAIRVASGKRSASLDRLEGRLRALPRPVIGRIAGKTLWLDLRCLKSADEAEFSAQWSTFER
jgi:L-seryl-tRNA(Ser) seleniumtransferase